MATDWMSAYHDICNEAEILELRLKDLERQLKLARSVCFSGKMPSDFSVPCFIPLDKALEQYDAVKEKLLSCEQELTVKRELLREMDKRINRFRGIEYRVAYMRDIEKKSLYSIADELGYSYQHIRRISANIGKIQMPNATIVQQIS